MGIYTRYKKNPMGLRQLVELWESAPLSRRQKMIDAGMQEDPEYTKKILSFVLTFEDVIRLPDAEFAEVVKGVPALWIGYCLYDQAQEVRDRFFSQVDPRLLMEVKEVLEDSRVSPAQVGAGKMKMVEFTRSLEKKGYVKTKAIPS